MAKKVQLVSGGLDSIMLDHYLDMRGDEHDKLWIDYGQPESAEEELVTRKLWPDAHIVRLSGASASRHGRYFPNRNLWLATTASLLLDADEIFLAGLGDDRCLDKDENAFTRMSEVLTKFAGHPVVVMSPFWNTDKSTAVHEYIRTGGSIERLLSSWSCYEPKDGRQCLSCEACFRWSVALRSNGLQVFPPNEEITKVYLKKLHEYNPKRIWSTLKGIQTPERKVLCYDIDGVLTNETDGWNYADRTPNFQNIEFLRVEYHIGNWIVLWSSRRSVDRDVTKLWLNRYDIPYHALLLDKPPYQQITDDLSVNPTL